MKKVILSLVATLITGCYDPGASANPEVDGASKSPTHAAPRLVGTIAVRSAGVKNDAALSDVEACVLDRADSCTWSAGDGLYALGPFTPNSRSKVSYSKPGLVPTIVEYDIPEHSLRADVFLFTAANVEQSARWLGVTHDPSRSGGVVLTVHTINYGGIVPLDGASARALGEAEFSYAGIANELDPALDRTTESGWAIALGVMPGVHRLEITHADPAAKCGRLTPSMDAFVDSSVVEVVPGSLTVATVYCFR